MNNQAVPDEMPMRCWFGGVCVRYRAARTDRRDYEVSSTSANNAAWA